MMRRRPDSKSFHPVELFSAGSIEARAFEKAEQALKIDKIDPHDFTDLYGEGTVQDHLGYVETMKQRFAAEHSREEKRQFALARILEAIIAEQVELSNWMGPDAMTRSASDYDDIANGVDSIVEIERDDATTHLALAMDVTYSKYLQKKFDRIKDEINAGTLATVRYFESTDGSFRGRLQRVPRVVVGTSPDALESLMQTWIDGKKDELAMHPLQLQLIDQMECQLMAQLSYAEKAGQHDLSRPLQRQLNIVRSIKRSKKDLRKTVDIQNISRGDRVHQEIMGQAILMQTA